MTTTSLRAGLYARVSTKQQAGEDKTSIADQMRRNREVCARQGWTIADEYRDEGVSGEELDRRPEMSRLLADAEAGRIDVIVAIDLDRLARDEFVFARVFKTLDRAEIAVHAEGTLYDPENLSQLLTRGIKAVVSSHDKRALVAKMAQGQRARGLAGGWPGGTPPYGYRLVWPESAGRKPLAQVEVDEDEAEMLRAAVAAIVDDGCSTGEACERLNALGYRTRGGTHGRGGKAGDGHEWTHQNLRRVLSSEALLGVVHWGKPTGRGDHRTRTRKDGTPRYGATVTIELTPLIERERFDALQAALALRAYGEKSPSKVYPLSGAASACGGRLGGVYRHDRDLRQYRCNRSKWNATGDPRCGCPRLDALTLEGRVWTEVCALLVDPDRLLEMADEYLGVRSKTAAGETDRLAELDQQIGDLERARVRAASDAIRQGLDSDLVRAVVEGIERDLARLVADRDRVQAIRADEQAAESRAVAIARLAERAQQRLPGMGLEEQQEVLNLLGVRVTVLDQTTMPAVRIEGELPGGGDLFPVTPSDPLDDLLDDGITTSDDTPRDPESEGLRYSEPLQPRLAES